MRFVSPRSRERGRDQVMADHSHHGDENGKARYRYSTVSFAG
ncbi:hypothetical protein [Rhizohabitans arisaemae]|nr:hypothetical protein [Rhizohabitans arisaemae]